jgi:transposase InsO family protein
MKAHRKEFPLSLMCAVFEVARSGYYAWLKRKPSRRSQENTRLALAIQAAHERSRETYGPLRLQPELAAEGFKAGLERIKRIRKELGLRCKQSRQFKATTNSKHTLPVVENRLNQDFAMSRPNQAWVSDITYIPTHEGWLYLAGVKDLHTCEIVGYALGSRMTQELVGQALIRAVKLKRPKPGLIHHSDRGSQYCAHSYQRLLRQFQMQASMSRRGNCYDNAPMESFWGTLKNELVHHRRYETRAEAIQEITEYIEIFYNRQRRHSKLGNLSPAAFAQQVQANSAGT